MNYKIKYLYLVKESTESCYDNISKEKINKHSKKLYHIYI